jgi:hypothetical protein
MKNSVKFLLRQVNSSGEWFVSEQGRKNVHHGGAEGKLISFKEQEMLFFVVSVSLW